MRILILLIFAVSALRCSPEHRSGNVSGITDLESPGGDGKTEVNPDALPYSEVVKNVFEPAGCFDCHGKFRKYETIIKTVDLTVPPEQTKLYRRSATDMPPIEEGYLPLTPEQLDLIREWIAQGANP